MNSEKYLEKLRGGGDVAQQLLAMADELKGPCGQSHSALEARQIKKNALLNAAQMIQAKRLPSTLDIAMAAGLWYPTMLAQERGEISQAKAAELLGLTQEEYEERKERAIQAVVRLVTDLPSPLRSLLEMLG